MNVWKVKTPSGEITVNAPLTEISESGILLFKIHSGDLIRAFAPGAWLECENLNKTPRKYAHD